MYFKPIVHLGILYDLLILNIIQKSSTPLRLTPLILNVEL